MTTETTTSSRPNWVYRIGEIAVPIATTFGLFAAVLAWGALDLYGDGLAAIGAMDAVEVTFLAVLATLFVAPPVLVANALLRRRLSTRQSWGVLAVLGGFGGLACLAWVLSGPAPALSSWGRSEAVEFLAFGVYVVLGLTLALAGPAIGVWLRRRSLPTDRRTLLVAGVVLAVLFAGPYAVGAAIDDGGDSDAFDPETGGDYQDDPAWNDSDHDESGTNDANETADDGGGENESDAMTETTLGSVRCAESPEGVRGTPELNHSVASNGTLDDDTRVQYYQIGGDHHVIRFNQWNETEIVSVAADGTGDPFAVDYLGVAEVFAGDDTSTRLWIDAVNDDGEVVRYQVDLCPPPE